MLVYKAMIEPTLTYSADSWVLREREKQRIQAAEMRVFREIAGVRRMNHVRNDDIRAQLSQEGVVEQVGRKREVWKKRVEEQIGSMTVRNEWNCTREKTKREAKKAMERCLLIDAKNYVDFYRPRLLSFI